jgi:hypothetical protein
MDNRANAVIKVKFSTKDCRSCAQVAQCIRSTKRSPRRALTIRPQWHDQALQTALQREATDTFRAEYARRAGIEGTMLRVRRPAPPDGATAYSRPSPPSSSSCDRSCTAARPAAICPICRAYGSACQPTVKLTRNSPSPSLASCEHSSAPPHSPTCHRKVSGTVIERGVKRSWTSSLRGRRATSITAAGCRRRRSISGSASEL